MHLLHRLLPRSIAAQITGLLIVAVAFGVALTSAVAISFYSHAAGSAWNLDTVAAVRAARIGAVVRDAQATRSAAELQAVLLSARRWIVAAQVFSPGAPAALPWDQWRSATMRSAIVRELEHTWRITPENYGASAGTDTAIVVDVGAGRMVAFRDAAPTGARRLIERGLVLVIAVITFGILLLSLYALRWITAPLESIASAAHAFGREPSRAEPLAREGPREIAELAAALNEMRARIRALVEERTRMLLAISHDLRTPLTRLRLRAERVPDDALREGMLHDITVMKEMLGEALSFLRDGARSEPVRPVDLPSLLRTICDEFSDVGHAVTYAGPMRLAASCRPRALGRAVTNLVENATKHGKTVSVVLCAARSEQMIQIEVSDDGPGIPPTLRERAFEPFFKVDPSRGGFAAGPGFGLGLCIARDVMRAHGGDIVLCARDGGGLKAVLQLTGASEEVTRGETTAVTTVPPVA